MVRVSSILIGVYLVTSVALFGQAPNAADADNDYKERTERLVSFLEFMLNTVGSESTSTRDKDVIITQSYSKIFRDAKVQVEDDLLE